MNTTYKYAVCVAIVGGFMGSAALAQQQQPRPQQTAPLTKPIGVYQKSASKSSSPDTNVPGGATDIQVGIKGIDTDAAGHIKELSVNFQNRTQFVRGCDARLSDLPHLLMHYQMGRIVLLSTAPNGCLSMVKVYK